MFPFTYSISGFREAIAGPLISTVFFDFTALIIMAAIFFIFGFFFKEPFYPLVKKFEIKFEQSGLGE
jgi:putative membrane protein